MDYEKLIEQLKQKDGLWCSVPTGEKLVTDAADALTALLAESEKLRAELERTKNNAFDEAMRAAVQAADKVLLDTELSHVKAKLEQVKRELDEAREAICTHCMDVPCQGESCYWWQGPEEG